MGEPKSRVIAGNSGRDGIEKRDRGADERRADHRESDLSDGKRCTAGEDADDERTDHTSTAVIGSKAGGQPGKLCGEQGYVAHARYDAVYKQDLRAARHILIGL